MVNDKDLNAVVDRAIEAFGCNSKTQLAKVLGISKQDLSNRMKRETLTPLLIKEAVNRYVNLNWLITGQGEMSLKGEIASTDNDLKSAEKASPKEINVEERFELVETRLAIIEKLLSESKPNPGRRWYDGKIAVKK